MKQLKAILEKGVSMDNPSKSKLSDFGMDNLAKCLAFNGFKDQGQGLLAFIDQHFEGRVMTTKLVRQEIPGIMTRAADFKSRKQQDQPGPSQPKQAEQSKANSPIQTTSNLAKQSKSKPPIQSTSNLARIQRFRELLRDCFDKHTKVAPVCGGAGAMESLKIDVVKAYFAKKEKKTPFSEEEFMAHIQKMENDDKLMLSGDDLYTM